MPGRISSSSSSHSFYIATNKNNLDFEKNNIKTSGTTSDALPAYIREKETPYYSDKRDAFLNFNGQVRDSSFFPIVCRHITSSWMDLFIKGKGQVDYKYFHSEEAIFNHVSVEKAEKYIRLSGAIHFLENENWGRAIFDIFTEMKHNGDKLRVLELSTTNHSMALGLKIKSNPNGERWVIYLYDPNHTATHQRAEYSCTSQTEIKKLTANDFFNEHHKKCYNLISDGLSILIDRHTPINTSFIKRYPDNLLQPKVVHYAIGVGLTEIIQKVTEEIQRSKPISNEIESLVVTPNDVDHPGLVLALQNGHADTIHAYGELLNNVELSPEKITDILLAKMDFMGGQLYGLSQALQNGHANAIRVYGELLNANAAGIGHAQMVELLGAHGIDGTGHQIPGLYWALRAGHADAVLAYGELLKAATLSQGETAILLAAKRYDNVPGLFIAIHNGHTEAINAYGKLLSDADLDSDKTAELLAAKNDDGIPALFMALHNGYIEAINAYGKLLSDVGLDSDKTAELLAAKNDDGVPALFMALHNGHTEAINAYGKLLSDAGLDSDKTAELLAAKNDDGVPALFMAFHNGHTEAIKAYGMVLNSLELYPEETEQLLAARCENGLTGLFLALAYGHTDSVRVYGELLFLTGLSPYKIEELLAAKGQNGQPGICMAFLNGHTETMRAYAEIFKNVGVTPEEVAEYLFEEYRDYFLNIVNTC